MKKTVRILLILMAAAFCYILAGAVLPFVCQPKVSEETKERFEQKNFYGETAGAERAAVLSDNVDALAERIRLISHAEERIILSTFEFRNDESGKDMMAAFSCRGGQGRSDTDPDGRLSCVQEPAADAGPVFSGAFFP